MAMLKAVLFDLDGTLVDSLPEIYHGVCETCRRLKLTPPSKEAVAAMIGRGVVVLVERLKRHLAVPDSVATEREMLDILVEEWDKTKGEMIDFYPGTLEGIRELREKGIRTALVTNKLRSLTVEFVKARGIEELFDTIVAGDDCKKAKPAPDMLLRAMDEIGVSAESVVMVGDSRNDALAARAAGVTAVLVETGYNEGVGIGEWAREAGFNRLYPSVRHFSRAVVSGRF